METGLLIIIIIVVIIIVFFLFKSTSETKEHALGDDTCNPNVPKPSPFGTGSAAEACRKISSRAEEIAAEYGGKKNLAESILKHIPIFSLFDPSNYKAGKSDSTSISRNIIDNDLSECEVQKIFSSCENSAANAQINIISTQNCEFCQKHGCNISGITQVNENAIKQQCMIQSAIETLLQKTNSVDAQALAKVLQDVSGLLSGDTTINTENCNAIRNDLSTKSYLESKANCVNAIAVTQENDIAACGNASDIVQKNSFNALQDCVIKNYIKNSSDQKGYTKTDADTETEQKSVGGTMSSIGSSIFLCVLVIGITIVGVVVGPVLAENAPQAAMAATPEGAAVQAASALVKH
jgi:hypothetical protein